MQTLRARSRAPTVVVMNAAQRRRIRRARLSKQRTQAFAAAVAAGEFESADELLLEAGGRNICQMCFQDFPPTFVHVMRIDCDASQPRRSTYVRSQQCKKCGLKIATTVIS